MASKGSSDGKEGGVLDSLKEGAQKVGEKIQEGFETAKSKIVGDDEPPTKKERLAEKTDEKLDAAKEKVRDVTGHRDPTVTEKVSEKVEDGLETAKDKVKEASGREDPTLTEKAGEKVEAGLDSIQKKVEEHKKD